MGSRPLPRGEEEYDDLAALVSEGDFGPVDRAGGGDQPQARAERIAGLVPQLARSFGNGAGLSEKSDLDTGAHILLDQVIERGELVRQVPAELHAVEGRVASLESVFGVRAQPVQAPQ